MRELDKILFDFVVIVSAIAIYSTYAIFTIGMMGVLICIVSLVFVTIVFIQARFSAVVNGAKAEGAERKRAVAVLLIIIIASTSSIISGMAWALTAYPIDLNPPSEEPNIVLNVTATDNTSFVVLIKDLDNEVPFQDINYGLFNATNYPVAGISITIRDLDNNSRVSKDDRFSITLSSQRPSDQTYNFQLSYRKSGEVLAEVKLP